MSELHAACRHCHERRPLSALLLVTEVHSGARFFVCRPSVKAVCFLVVGSAQFHRIALASSLEAAV
jgi:hypothetical protein